MATLFTIPTEWKVEHKIFRTYYIYGFGPFVPKKEDTLRRDEWTKVGYFKVASVTSLGENAWKCEAVLTQVETKVPLKGLSTK